MTESSEGASTLTADVVPSSPTNSTFYLSTDGELNRQSFEIPTIDRSTRRNVEEMLSRLVDETADIEKSLTENKVVEMAKQSLRL
jgi:hypothetical protein